MRFSRRLEPAIGIGAAIALLTACSGGSAFAPSSSQGVANGTVGGALRVASRSVHSGWLSPVAKRGKALLFVADQGNQVVRIYPQGGGANPAPIGEITDAIGGPDGLFVDQKGTLYVCNFGSGTVTEYPKGQTTHSKTLTGAGSPKYVVAGVDGTVYVSNFNASVNGDVVEYAGGSTTPTQTIPFQSFPAGLALDAHNRLYAAYNDLTNSDVEVLRFAPGKTAGKNLGIHLKFGYAGGATVDANGDFVVADQAHDLVDVFPPGETQPSQQIGGFIIAYQVALNHKDSHLYVSAPSGAVAEVTYPAGVLLKTITNSLGGAYGVATSPDGSR